ncbi:MAG: hypothetical protein R3F29_15330, partial [Planctomycetota bacterium]
NGVARWDGVAWSPMDVGVAGTISSLHASASGEVFATGRFVSGSSSFTGVARWNGAAWVMFGQAGLSCVTTLPNGDVIVGGNFTTIGGVAAHDLARWDGVGWSEFAGGSNGQVKQLEVLLNDELVVAGSFTQVGGVAAAGVARWNGTSWSAVAGGIDDGYAAALHFTGEELVVGGTFGSVGGVPCTRLLRLSTDCLPDVSPLGAGCPSSGGSNTLTVDAPWAGSMWRSTATGLPPAALLLVVDGFATTSLSLDTLFATAQAGCTLHVAPESVGLAIGGGQVTFAAKLPRNPALAGVVWHRQIVSMALDPTLAVTATNALRMTIGFF